MRVSDNVDATLLELEWQMLVWIFPEHTSNCVSLLNVSFSCAFENSARFRGITQRLKMLCPAKYHISQKTLYMKKPNASLYCDEYSYHFGRFFTLIMSATTAISSIALSTAIVRMRGFFRAFETFVHVSVFAAPCIIAEESSVQDNKKI